MPFSVVGLSPQEQKLVYKLVEAAQYVESIYWRQRDPKGLELLRRLAGCNTVMALKVRRYLVINGSRYDLLEENKPFVGCASFSLGRNIYPIGIRRQYIDGY